MIYRLGLKSDLVKYLKMKHCLNALLIKSLENKNIKTPKKIRRFLVIESTQEFYNLQIFAKPC